MKKIKKTGSLLVFIVLMANLALAQTIDLNAPQDLNLMQDSSIPVQTSGILSSDILDIINQNKLTHALIDDYSAIALKVDRNRYVARIDNNSITSVDLDDNAVVGYTIETTTQEAVTMAFMCQTSPKIDLFQKFVMAKDIPFNVKIRVLKIILGGGY